MVRGMDKSSAARSKAEREEPSVSVLWARPPIGQLPAAQFRQQFAHIPCFTTLESQATENLKSPLEIFGDSGSVTH